MAQQRSAMAMAGYLGEVRHAVEGLLPLIWQEQDALSGLEGQFAERKDELVRLERQVRDEYANVAWLVANGEDSDDDGLATLRYWDNYFGPDKERFHLEQQIPGLQTAVESLQASVEAHRFSVDALAGAVIQIAKQGLALVHGGKPTATGRTIGSSQQLSDVIWLARNQALHWEEQSFRQPVVDCFTSLASEVDRVFSDYRTRNMALDVIKMLGWRTFEDFEGDLLSVG